MSNATLNRVVPIYIDGDRAGGMECALDGKTSSLVAIRPAMMAGDVLTLDIYFRRRAANGTASAALELPSGSVIAVAGKASNAMNVTDLLFLGGSFTLTGTGTDDARYSGTVDLNTSNIAAAMAALSASDKFISVQMDIEVQNSDDTGRMTFRTEVYLYRQVYNESEAPSVITSHTTLTDPDGGLWRLSITSEGVLQQVKI